MTSPEKNESPFDLETGVPEVPEVTPEITGDLRPKPRFVDRISKRVVGIGLGFMGVIIAIVFVSLDAMDKKKSASPDLAMAQTVDKPESENVPKDLTGGDNADGKDGQRSPSLVKPEKPQAASAIPGTEPGEGTMFPPGGVRVPSVNSSADARIPKNKDSEKSKVPGPEEQAADAARQAELAAKQQRELRMQQAMSDGLSVRPFDTGDDKRSDGGGRDSGFVKTSASVGDSNVGNGGNGGNGGRAPGAQGEQDEKLSFVKDAAKDDRSYHQHRPVTALSPNELKTGSFIPLSLAQGINSDLPGQITARVTENVYDTISGCRLLIPAMSTVVGKYDSKVAIGQARILVVWNSVIFPDGEELNLAGMQGYDTAGYSGLDSEVDNHFWRLFGLAFGMSMLTAGVEMSVPQQTNTGTSAQTPSQMIATALAQQYGQLGAQILGKYMAVQPTLRNAPGERFLIMIPRTIVLSKVWRNRCEGQPEQ